MINKKSLDLLIEELKLFEKQERSIILQLKKIENEKRHNVFEEKLITINDNIVKLTKFISKKFFDAPSLNSSIFLRKECINSYLKDYIKSDYIDGGCYYHDYSYYTNQMYIYAINFKIPNPIALKKIWKSNNYFGVIILKQGIFRNGIAYVPLSNYKEFLTGDKQK